MAKAYKCDKCGKFYLKTPDYNHSAHKFNGDRLDLCPECQKQLDIFLRKPDSYVEESTEMDPEEAMLYAE